MRVLIVDDEPHARSKLRRMLEAFADVDVVGEASDGIQAVARCVERLPDAIFLDMQMPEMDGFGVIARLPAPRPAVVLVTAFEQHALGAFDAEVTDYLLKPVASERLERTVKRLRASAPAPAPRPIVEARPRLLVSDRGKTAVVDHSDIEWLESADNYVHVHTRARSFLLRRTLASLLDELGVSFVRVHRCFAIRVDRVTAVHARGKGNGTVMLRDGRELPCSRQHKPALMTWLQRLPCCGANDDVPPRAVS